MSNEKKIKEGDVYSHIIVGGRSFTVLYGPYDDPEQPDMMVPYFPDFDNEPVYTDDGFPFRDTMTDDCEHYVSKNPDRSDGTCEDCTYRGERMERICVCRCTALRRRDKQPLDGNLMRIALIGKLPTAEKIIRNAYRNVQIDKFERATDMPFKESAYDLAIVESYAGEGLGIRGLTYTYNVDNNAVQAPVRLLAEPPCESAEIELSVFIRTTLAKKVNENND